MLKFLGTEFSILFLYMEYLTIDTTQSGFLIQFIPIFIIIFLGSFFFFISRMQKLK